MSQFLELLFLTVMWRNTAFYYLNHRIEVFILELTQLKISFKGIHLLVPNQQEKKSLFS